VKASTWCKNMNKLIPYLICLAAGFFAALYFYSRTASPGSGPSVTLVEHVVVEKIQRAAKLVTIEHFIADVVDFKEDEPFYKKDKKALIIAKGKVSAGFDLNRGIAVSVASPEKLISIRLPEPQILSVDCTYKFYDKQGDITIDDDNYLLTRSKSTLQGAALKAGILQQAKESIKNQLGLYFENYKVSITFGDIPPAAEKRTDEPRKS
jgi:hypothetical protein